jgi:hypothetical protein
MTIGHNQNIITTLYTDVISKGHKKKMNSAGLTNIAQKMAFIQI